MFFTIKTLQQKTFKVELDDSENVLALKRKIEESQGEAFPASSMRLIYAGKILNDATALSEYKIQENSFVVVMVSKPKPKPAEPSASTPEQQQTTTSGQTATPQTSTAEQEASQPQAQASITTSTSSSTTTTSSTPTPLLAAPQPPVAQTSGEPPSSEGDDRTDGQEGTTEHHEGVSEEASAALVQGSDYEQAVSNLMSLGFPREQVVLALNASFNNPDRAADYLYNGIPDSVYEQHASAAQQQASAPVQPSAGEGGGQQQVQSQPQQPSQQVQQPGVGGEGQAEGRGDPLANLRTMPQFRALRQVIRNNPQMLPPLLQQIGASNPQLLQLITQNQQQFIDLLNEPEDGSSAAPAQGRQVPQQPPHPQPQVPGGQPGEGGAGGVAPPYGQPLSIQVSPDEKAAIDRFTAMGFPEHLVIQAYFACDKNEELTAEFLLNQDPNDD